MEDVQSQVPLLDQHVQASASEPSPNHGELWIVTPMPWRQVSIVAFAALAEPVTVNFVYPFINEMIAGMSSSPEQLAFRSGIFFGCFSFAQFAFVVPWGALSDRIGRKPVILACVALGAASTTAFGLSKSFVTALISRTLTGACYGDVPVLRSAMGDLTDSTNQARAFSFIPLAWAVGATFAPLLGGFLSHPVEHFPRRFGDSDFLRDHPYALPCFATAFLSVLVFVVVALFFRETLPSKSKSITSSPNTPDVVTDEALIQQPSTSIPSYGAASLTIRKAEGAIPAVTDPATEVPPPPSSGNNSRPLTPVETRPSVREILAHPGIKIILLSYWFLSLISTSNDVIFALWMFLGVDIGGLGLTPAQIATALSIGSIMSTLVLVVLFPWLHKRYGTLSIYRSAISLDVLFIVLYPLVHWIASSHSKQDGSSLRLFNDPDDTPRGKRGIWDDVPLGVMVGLGGMLVVKALASLAWGCNMILVTAAAPTQNSLGAVNSMAQMTASLARAMGPPIYSTVFAFSMSTGILGGKGLIWIFMGIMASISLLVSFFVQEGEQEWRRRTTNA